MGKDSRASTLAELCTTIRRWDWLALLLSLFISSSPQRLCFSQYFPEQNIAILYSCRAFFNSLFPKTHQAILSTYLSTMFSSHKCAFKMLFPVVNTLLPNADMVHGRFQCPDWRCFMMMCHRFQNF